MDKSTLKDVIKTYLKEKDFLPKEITKIMKNFETGIKDIKKERDSS